MTDKADDVQQPSLITKVVLSPFEEQPEEGSAYLQPSATPLSDEGVNCAGHKKDLFGQSDMKIVAEAIGDLHYESLKELLAQLSEKLYLDGSIDFDNGRRKISFQLADASKLINRAYHHIEKAWQISKPFMESQPVSPVSDEGVKEESFYIWNGIENELEEAGSLDDCLKWVKENYTDPADGIHPDIELIEIFKKVSGVVLKQVPGKETYKVELSPAPLREQEADSKDEEIKRLKGLIEKAYMVHNNETHAYSEFGSWQKFKNENGL